LHIKYGGETEQEVGNGRMKMEKGQTEKGSKKHKLDLRTKLTVKCAICRLIIARRMCLQFEQDNNNVCIKNFTNNTKSHIQHGPIKTTIAVLDVYVILHDGKINTHTKNVRRKHN